MRAHRASYFASLLIDGLSALTIRPQAATTNPTFTRGTRRRNEVSLDGIFSHSIKARHATYIPSYYSASARSAVRCCRSNRHAMENSIGASDAEYPIGRTCFLGTLATSFSLTQNKFSYWIEGVTAIDNVNSFRLPSDLTYFMIIFTQNRSLKAERTARPAFYLIPFLSCLTAVLHLSSLHDKCPYS